MAESGEYLYCPPQRWLNNLHHGVPVFLYHPCTSLHERLSLSVLARSCLPDYIITPHPQLNKNTPIALVSWGRTLELSTIASSDVCVWLETTTTTQIKLDGVNQSRNYNLLLTWPAEQQHTHAEETLMKGSLRRCCQQTISSLLNGAMETELESSMMKKSLKQMKDEAKSRHIRAAVRETVGNIKDETASRRTEEVQNYNNTLGLLANSPPKSKTLSDPPGPKEAPSLFKSLHQGLAPRPTTPFGLSTLRSDSLGFGVDELQKTNSKPKASDKHSIKENNSKVKNSDKDITADGNMRDKKVIDIKEREVGHKQKHSGTHSNQSETTGTDSVSKSQLGSPPQPQQHPNTKTASYLPRKHDCDGCKADEHCECARATGAEARAAVVKKGLPRTPRTDEAMWAAAALGFLLILLTLSVLHTRLYRNWRTMPSLYWHDPRQDYDSVADVIRRRLRIAKRRRKRGRRQECVLLPSSSSSDEHP
ncbi:tumor protein p53-inducible protein 13 isoform X2 [Anabas testudineus]|nr:tumor protein p53-inducible protein 13 isoform X2 [Anabas testudineus]